MSHPHDVMQPQPVEDSHYASLNRASQRSEEHSGQGTDREQASKIRGAKSDRSAHNLRHVSCAGADLLTAAPVGRPRPR